MRVLALMGGAGTYKFLPHRNGFLNKESFSGQGISSTKSQKLHSLLANAVCPDGGIGLRTRHPPKTCAIFFCSLIISIV